jgi:hypothetical protein
MSPQSMSPQSMSPQGHEDSTASLRIGRVDTCSLGVVLAGWTTWSGEPEPRTGIGRVFFHVLMDGDAVWEDEFIHSFIHSDFLVFLVGF